MNGWEAGRAGGKEGGRQEANEGRREEGGKRRREEPIAESLSLCCARGSCGIRKAGYRLGIGVKD